MRNHDHRFTAHQLFERFLQFVFVIGVNRSRRFIHNDDGCVFQDGARNSNALRFATRQVHAFRSNKRILAFLQLVDDAIKPCCRQRRHYFFMRCVALSTVNVVEKRVIEQFGVLKHEGNFANKRLLRVGGKWFSANEQRA